MFYKANPVNISNLTNPVMSFPDKVFGGHFSFDTYRNIYELKDLYCYKNQIISKSNNGIYINILGAKAERRNFVGTLSILDKIKLSRAKKINNSKNNFIFIPHQRFKNNYWHALVDNISQLVFMLQNNTNLNVFIPEDTGSFIKNYIYFLKKNFNFSIQEYDVKTPFHIISKVVLTDPPLLGGFEHNKNIADILIDEAARELKVKNINKKNISYKFGTTPHHIKFSNNNLEKTVKANTVLRSSPVRSSSLHALRNMGITITKEQKLPTEVIYSQRVGENPKDKVVRNPINENEFIKIISNKLNANIIDFSKLSFEKQIQTMQSAKLFICVHGSGPTNAIFMKKNTHFIEIMPYQYSLPTTKMSKILSEALEIKYHKIDGLPINGKYNIPIDALLEIISKLKF